ncbi:hypothetical protein [Streptomyces resistomycificus]|nr:hypothetical protein [Streptomyces resistomycificus]
MRQNRGPVRGRGAPSHPALSAWTVEVFERYVAARGTEQRAAPGGRAPPTEPVRLSWMARTERREVLDARGAGQYEHTTWGRKYASADGSDGAPF